MKASFPLAAAAATCALVCALPAQAAILTYAGTLTGLTENPPIITPGTGNATVIIDDLTSKMRVVANFSGLIGTTTVAHVHCCSAVPFAGNVGVATVTPTFTGFPAGVMAGSYDQTFDMTAAAGSWNSAFVTANGGTPASAFNALLTGLKEGRAYFNLHTSFAAGGEIRGLLQAVPEPGSLALVLAAVGLAAASTRKRVTG
jgi:hypothetical protein